MRAACYLRQSLDKTGEAVAIARQREDCLAICADKGWSPVEYTDNDTSASDDKQRPRYQKMLADIQDGQIGAVVVWDLDRLHRRPIELERFMDLADQHRLALATVSGDVDLNTAQGRLVARLKGAVARHEIEHKVARQKRAAKQKAENGQPHWQHAFGYMPGPNGPLPDPATAPLVKAAYAQILAGGSLKDICGMWNDAAAFTLSGKPWIPSLVSPFLRKPRNCGLRTHNGEIVGTASWPALVDESTWRAAQTVMKAPSRGSGSRKSVRRHLLTGLLVCGRCGDTLGGQWTTTKRISYACKGCHKVSIRAEHVEPLLYGLVSGRLAMPDAIDLLKAEIHDSVAAERIRLELETLYGELDSIGAERGEGLLTGKQAKLATDVVAAKIAKLERQQQDSERLRVFDGIPLGKSEVADAIQQLSPDRFRAVLAVLATVVVLPVGKGGGRIFNPERVQVNWK